MQMSAATEHNMYLGLPNTMRRNKNVILGFLKEKVRKRVVSWDGQIMNKAGKEIMLKTVVQALSTYSMNVFLLPLQMCKDIEQLMCNYGERRIRKQEKVYIGLVGITCANRKAGEEWDSGSYMILISLC